MTHFRRKALLLFAMASYGILPAQAAGVLLHETFDNGAGEFWTTGVTVKEGEGKLCALVPAGGSPWDAMIGVNDLALVRGERYRLELKLDGDISHRVAVKVQQGAEPWAPQGEAAVVASSEGAALSHVFEAQHGEVSQLVLQLGGAGQDWNVCLDDVVLSQEAAEDEQPLSSGTAPSATGGMAIRVNQTGYLTNGPKRATVLSDASEPLAYRLFSGDGIIVGEGTTQPMGFDPSAGAGTHRIDFSSFASTGAGYRLEIDGRRSYPFAIGDDFYGRLRTDALSWFYIARSGIEIDGRIAGKAYGRPAGHVGVRPNKGDTDVSCLTGAAARALYGDWRCKESRDVSGGWYDAGDQGKYVVNGGISVAQLMGAFERAKTIGADRSPILSDGTSRIPESGNGVPDILDEARWELEFLLRMIVPDGEPLAGMAYHKVHDTRWTGVPMLPHLDPEERALHRPSTAATLNVAAAAAQGARLFEAYDPAFSKQLLSAARKTFAAATKNAVLYAPASDGSIGGGDYNDANIADETYWAAAELFITTGESAYLDVLKVSPFWSAPVFSTAGAFNWADTAGLARLQLALYATKLDDADRDTIRASVIEAADTFLAAQASEPFGHIYQPADGKYDWGSNHLILQNMIIVAAAYDLTGGKRYLAGVRESMDYILGRNAMNISYVTGYGSVWSKNQHSRTFAHQADASYPHPPAGSLAGGPNSYLADPLAEEKLQGCAPQTCYLDDISSWSTNELTINWNAPLVYVASFLADTR